MSVLDQIRRQGFTVRPVDTGLYIEPIVALSERQRQWLTSNKAQIRRQLLHERWKWFVSLATEHGIHPDVAAAEFASEQDRLDVIEPAEHDDETLRRCMTTLCTDARVLQRQQEYESGRWVSACPTTEPETVRQSGTASTCILTIPDARPTPYAR